MFYHFTYFYQFLPLGTISGGFFYHFTKNAGIRKNEKTKKRFTIIKYFCKCKSVFRELLSYSHFGKNRLYFLDIVHLLILIIVYYSMVKIR